MCLGRHPPQVLPSFQGLDQSITFQEANKRVLIHKIKKLRWSDIFVVKNFKINILVP